MYFYYKFSIKLALDNFSLGVLVHVCDTNICENIYCLYGFHVREKMKSWRPPLQVSILCQWRVIVEATGQHQHNPNLQHLDQSQS